MDKNYYEEKIKSILKDLKSADHKYKIQHCFEEYFALIQKYTQDTGKQFNIETYKTKRKIPKEPKKAIEEMEDDLKELYYWIFQKII